MTTWRERENVSECLYSLMSLVVVVVVIAQVREDSLEGSHQIGTICATGEFKVIIGERVTGMNGW